MSLMKKDSTSVSPDTSYSDTTDPGTHTVQEVYDRSISTTSHDSSRSLNRNYSYEAALDHDDTVPVDSGKENVESQTEIKESDSTCSRDTEVPPEADKPDSVSNSLSAEVKVKRKAPPPPRPSADPVGQLPRLPGLGDTPARSASPPVTTPARTASPPVTAPKPSQRVIAQAKSTSGSQPGSQPGSAGVRKLPSSISTPNISKHLHPDHSPSDSYHGNKEVTHHKSSSDLKDKEGSSGNLKDKEGSSGKVQQMVSALSRIASNREEKASPSVKKRTGSFSKFFYDLDGGEAKAQKSRDSASKKEKRKSSGSVFYRDVAVSKNGTLKFEGVKDPSGSQGVCACSDSVTQELAASQLLAPSADSPNKTSSVPKTSPVVKHRTKKVKSDRVQDCKDSVPPTEVTSSDDGLSPVAPPRTKKKKVPTATLR